MSKMSSDDRERRWMQSYDMQEYVVQDGILLDVSRSVGAAWQFMVCVCMYSDISSHLYRYSCNRFDDSAAKQARDAQEVRSHCFVSITVKVVIIGWG